MHLSIYKRAVFLAAFFAVIITTYTAHSQEISSLNIKHQFGNVIVQNASSDQVDVELKYQGKSTPANLQDALLVKSRNGTRYIQTDFGNSIKWKPGPNERVDMILSVPTAMALEIQLRFGDVLLEERQGNLRLDLSHGSFVGDALLGEENLLHVSFGNITLSKLRHAEVKLNHSGKGLKIDKARQLNFIGSHSSVLLGEVDELNCVSQFGDVTIDKVGVLNGKLSNARMDIGEVALSINFSTNLAERFRIHRFGSGFKGGELSGNLSKFQIGHTESFGIELECNVILGSISPSNLPGINWTIVNSGINSELRKGNWGQGGGGVPLKLLLNNGNLQLSKN